MFSKIAAFLKKPDFGLLVIRLVVGSLFIAHGVPKFLKGKDTLIYVGKAMSLFGISAYPVLWGFLAALTEVLGGALLVIGFKTRPAAFFLTILMVVAALFNYENGGGFLKVAWPAELAGVFFGLLFLGAGKYSVDKA